MKIKFLPSKINKAEAKEAKLDPEKTLFAYKAFKKQLLKDLQKAKKFMGEEPEAELNFYLSIDHEYPDKVGKKMPVLVLGKASGPWIKFIKKRVTKEAKKTDAFGTFRFDPSKKEELGVTFVELSIEKGKAKRMLIKKLIDKWLLPDGLQISFGGNEEFAEEDVEDVDSQIVADDKGEHSFVLDPKDKVQALFIKLKEGGFDQKKEHAVRAKIRTFIDNWLEKYDTLNDKTKESFKHKKGNYDYILDWLDNNDSQQEEKQNNSDDIGLMGLVLNRPNSGTEFVDYLYKINKKEIDKPGKFEIIRRSSYNDIDNAIDKFNAEDKDLDTKKRLFVQLMGMIKGWLDDHKKDDHFKKLNALYNKLKKFLDAEVSLNMTKDQIDKISDSKKLYSETAGTKKSSEMAREVRDATVDERAIHLVKILKRGEASNDDKVFGATMKWLADNVYDELEEKYTAGTKQVYGAKKASHLLGDILAIFGAKTLRTRYLKDKLKDEQSPYASLAFKLGLMGNTWRDSLKGDGVPTAMGATAGGAVGGALGSLLGPAGIALGVELGLSFGSALGSNFKIDGTIEREDAMSEIIGHYGIEDINVILNAPKDPSSYEGAIRIELETNHPNMLQQIKSNAKIKELKQLMDLPKDIEKLKNIIKAENNGEKKEEYEELLKKLGGQLDEVKKKHRNFDPDDAEEEVNKANDKYLCDMIHRLRKEGRLGKKLDKNTLIEGIMDWAKKASPDEIEAMLKADSKFMIMLEDMSGTFSYSGIDDGDLAFIKEKLNAVQHPPSKGEETNAIFDQLKAIAEQQHTKSALSRWAQNKAMGEQFKAILFDENVKDPQRAIITKFNKDKLERWEEIEAAIKQENDPKELKKLQKELEEIFDKAYIGVQQLMDRAGVHQDFQKEICETIRSNGAKGAVYQELVRLAKTSRPIINFGEDVLTALNTLKPGSPEFAAIAADTDLLKILQARTLGRFGFEGNIKQWKAISKELNLSPPLSDTKISSEQRKEGADEDNFKRKHRMSRAKLMSEKEIEEQNDKVKEQEKQAAFWAARLSFEYEKYFGILDDEHRLLQTVYEAQKSNVDIADVLEELSELNPKAYNYIKNSDKHACKVICNAENGETISAKEVLIDSRKSVTLKRTVDSKEVVKLFEIMSLEDIIMEAFDFPKFKGFVEKKKALIQDIEALGDTEADAKIKATKQKDLAKLNARIKQFDISSSFMDTIDEVLPPQKALDVKKTLRFKIGAELMKDGDNAIKKMFADDPLNFSPADIKLIGMDIKAISDIEVQKQSETGLQWSSQSSRMLQRDMAAAEFLTKGWERNERIEAMEGLIPEEALEREKESLFKGLQEAEGKLQEAQEKFEERKKEYDERLAKVVAALTQAVIFTLSMASGVGAAAGVIQLVWALASKAMETAITEIVKGITSGDRSGGMREKLEDGFFTLLANEAGAITGLVGANLAFALDVKALGVMSQGKDADGKALLGAWENILKTPFLKTARGAIKNTFEDIGSRFVKNLTDEKESALANPIDSFKSWGYDQIKNLPRAYLKSLLMTTAATGVGALADALDWKEIKFMNPDAAGSNRYTATTTDANGVEIANNRAFAADDARLGFWGSDKEGFDNWFNDKVSSSPKAWAGGQCMVNNSYENKMKELLGDEDIEIDTESIGEI